MSAAQPPVDQRPLLPWTLSFMRPYRGRVAGVAVLMLLLVGLGALQPWPLKIVIVRARAARTEIPALGRRHQRRNHLGVGAFVLSGVVLQLIHQVSRRRGQTDTGQRMVYDLRYLARTSSRGLNHHITTNTGDGTRGRRFLDRVASAAFSARQRSHHAGGDVRGAGTADIGGLLCSPSCLPLPFTLYANSL